MGVCSAVCACVREKEKATVSVYSFVPDPQPLLEKIIVWLHV